MPVPVSLNVSTEQLAKRGQPSAQNSTSSLSTECASAAREGEGQPATVEAAIDHQLRDSERSGAGERWRRPVLGRGQFRMESVVGVPVEVERHIEVGDEKGLDDPGCRRRRSNSPMRCRSSIGKCLFADPKGHSRAGSDVPQLDIEFVGQQRPECLSQRRTLGTRRCSGTSRGCANRCRLGLRPWADGCVGLMPV